MSSMWQGQPQMVVEVGCEHGGDCGESAIIECWNPNDKEWMPICAKHRKECDEKKHKTRKPSWQK